MAPADRNGMDTKPDKRPAATTGAAESESARGDHAFASLYDLIEARPDTLDRVWAIAAHYTRSDHSEESTRLLYDYLIDQLAYRWRELTGPWTTLAHTIARRQAPKQRKRARRLGERRLEPDVLEAVAGDQSQRPDALAIEKEEREHVLSAMAELSDDDRRIVLAFMYSSSMRAAARGLHMPGSTYRMRLYEVISKIQPD